MPVKPNARITLRSVRARFASHGGEKLDHAVRRFAIDLAGKVCLDAGAPTGGAELLRGQSQSTSQHCP